MSAATMQSTPAIPPRPSRSQDKADAASPPIVPPRPATNRKFQRSVSPNPDRFAQSPFHEGPISSNSSANRRYSSHGASHLGHELERSTSVDLPGPGEEGAEYAAAIEMGSSPEETRQYSTSPEQTRTIGEDIKLHAPKPQVPAQSAKERVATVTRTDSDRAAAFGIGRPSSTEQNTPQRSLRKKASTASQLSQTSHTEDEHGIPEIGQRVPMLSNAGDVQAPSPAPSAVPTEGSKPSRHHVRKTSSRGFNELPPGSYGLHGHGVSSTDKLDKAYYEKHPEIAHKEHFHYQYDRPSDFSLSSADLNKIVRDTASRGAGPGASTEYVGTPSEQVGFEASEAYASRISSPRPSSTAPKEHVTSPLKSSFSGPEIAVDDADDDENDGGVIHVEDPDGHRGFAKFGHERSAVGDAEEAYVAPILAPDEVAKDPSPYELYPAVEPPPERRGSAFEIDEPRSRPTSRPASIYSPPPPEMHSTPLEDVEEYEPLFPENEKNAKHQLSPEKLKEARHKFPSRDIWEDAPNSVHTTAEVSTPEVLDARSKPREPVLDAPPRDGETPAQAFARRLEEIAEKEHVGPDSYLNRSQKAPAQALRQPHLSNEMQGRPGMTQRFPSRDVWEDSPDSLQFTTTVSGPQSDEPSSPVEGPKTTTPPASNKPAIPARPKKQGSGDDATSKPSVPARPKPHVPARPGKPASESKEADQAAKPKPAVPARPVGGKIAALQAGFMSDLNNRLKLGPQAPKKEESTAAAPDLTEEKEKAPLADARKGRARGPQRRAPTKASSPSNDKSTPPPANNGKPLLSFSITHTLWSIDEEGTMTVEESSPPAATEIDTDEKVIKIQEPAVTEVAAEEALESDVVNPASEKKAHERTPTEPESTEASEAKSDPTLEDSTTEETKTLVTNTAGESVLEETIEKKPGDQVEKVESTDDEVKA